MSGRRAHRWAAAALALLAATPARSAGDTPTRVGEASAAAEPADAQVPHWASSWKDIWLQARQRGSLQLSTRASTSAVSPGRSEVFVVVDVQALEFPASPPSPLNLAIVIDSSASMNGPRLLTVQRVVRDVISKLAAADRLSIIRTNTEAETLPAALVTPPNRERMLAFVDSLKPQGSSDLSAGFTAALEQVLPARNSFGANRVLLISDGRLTHGMNDPAGLAQMAREVRENQRIHVSTVTIGEDSDRELMEGIAREGWGFTEYVSDSSREPRMGRRLKEEQSRRAAERVELTLTPPKGISVLDVFEHDELRSGDELRIPLYELGHGEKQRVVLRLAFEAKAPGPLSLGTVELSWHDALTESQRSARVPLSVTVAGGTGSERADPEVVRIAYRDLAERNQVWAEGAFQEGNLPQALELIDSTKTTLRQGRALLGPDAFSEEITRLTQIRARYAPEKEEPAPGPRKRRKKK